MSEVDRIPPQSLDAEAALLGALMVDRDIMDSVAPIVRPEDFYAHVHESLFGAMVSLHGRGEPLDKISVAEELRRRGLLEKIGGLSYLSSLMDTVQTASSASYYAELVAEKASLRGLIRAGAKIAEAGYEGESDASAALSQATKELALVTDRRTLRSRGYNLRQAGERADEAERRQGAGYLTPWPRLDRLIGGFVGGDLVVWAADPGVGKTTCLNMLATYTAEKYCRDGLRDTGCVPLFATEMGVNKTYWMLVALYSGVSRRRMREHKLLLQGEKINAKPLTAFDLDCIAEARLNLEFVPIELLGDNRIPLAVDDVVAHCRRMHRQRPIASVFIDTLGKLVSATPRRRGESKHEVQERVCDSLMFLSEELEVPVHIAHHLSRKDRTANQRPTLLNLRDGGNIEGTATSVIFAHEEKVGNSIQNLFIVAKARAGSRGEVPMNAIGHRTVWLEQDQVQPSWINPMGEQQKLFTSEPPDALDFDGITQTA